MKISFLIPSKNRLALLKRCLQTIYMQEGDLEFEIVISDNASNEDYRSYVEELRDPRIVYFRQPNALPVTDNWCAALSQATGDYVLMLGDDDGLAPDFFSTVRQFLLPDGPDIVYLAAYHYCYPNVLPKTLGGYLASVGCEFLPNDGGPFCLLPHYARDLATSVLDFRHRYGLNAQHFLIRRSFIDEISDIGPIYQSPYPDFFAAVVTFIRAHSITVIPKPLVVIGISPKSFGAYYFSFRQKQGYEFLANEQIESSILDALKDFILPGDMNNTNWLIAAETARRAINSSHPCDLNIDRYSAIQINWMLRHLYLDKTVDESGLVQVRDKLSRLNLLLFENLRAAIDVIATDSKLLDRVIVAIERQTAQYSPSRYSIIDIGDHKDILDAVHWLGGARRSAQELDRKNPLPILYSRIKGMTRKVTMRGAARAALVRLLPPVRRLYERTARDASIIVALEAANAELRMKVRNAKLEKTLDGAQSGSVAEAPTAGLQIVITRAGKHIVISPNMFDDFEFKHGDELEVIPLAEAAKCLRTPEQHLHIPTGNGYGIRVPQRMNFAPFKGFYVPEHLVALTGAGVETLDVIGKSHVAAYAKHLGISPDMSFLEIGSGIGRDAFQLIDYLSVKGRYTGVDVQRELILWCQRHISRQHQNFEFYHFNAFHELHNPLATKTTMEFHLPCNNRSVDRVALGSVFTHIFEDEVVHYLREIARVLRPDGLVYATFFLYAEEIVAASRANKLTPYNLRFEYPYGDGCYINDKIYPSGGVAYTDAAMQRMIRKSGLRLDRPYLKGAWSGYYAPQESDDGQDVAILRLANT